MKHLIFRIRLMLLYPFGMGAALYFRAVRSRFPQHAARVRATAPRLIGKLFLWLHGAQVETRNAAYLDAVRSGGVIFANHTSRLDPYVLFAILPFAYRSFWSTRAHVTTERLEVVRRYGELLELFYVHDKRDRRRTAREFRRARDYVRQGNVLSVFPEGRFAPDGQALSFGVACTKLAIEAGVPIVPVVIRGTRGYFEAAGVEPHGTISVQVLPPVLTRAYSPKQARELNAAVEAMIRRPHEALARPPAPIGPGDRSTAWPPDPRGRLAPQDGGGGLRDAAPRGGRP